MIVVRDIVKEWIDSFHPTRVEVWRQLDGAPIVENKIFRPQIASIDLRWGYATAYYLRDGRLVIYQPTGYMFVNALLGEAEGWEPIVFSPEDVVGIVAELHRYDGRRAW